MDEQKRANLLEKFSGLGDLEQHLLNLLAVFYGTMAKTSLLSCLGHLGVALPGKPPLKILNQVLDSLLAKGLLERGDKGTMLRCSRALVEVLVRRLVDQGTLARYDQVLKREHPGAGDHFYYLSEIEAWREARLGLYLGDRDRFNKALQAGQRTSRSFPYTEDLLLSLFFNPLDPEWTLAHLPEASPDIFGYAALHQLIHLYSDSRLTLALDRLSKETRDFRWHLMERTALELQLLRGQWQQLAERLTGVEDGELQAIGAALRFLQGEIGEACALYEQALVRWRKERGKRTGYFYGLAGVFYPLALLKSEVPGVRAKLAPLMVAIAKGKGFWQEVYRMLAIFLQQQQATTVDFRSQMRQFLYPLRLTTGFADSGEPLSLYERPLLDDFFAYLFLAWMSEQLPAEERRAIAKLGEHFRAHGYLWLAGEVDALLAPDSESPPPGVELGMGSKGLASLFAKQSRWERALEALSYLGRKDKQGENSAKKTTRLIWLVRHEAQYQTIALEPREQKQSASGSWSKGRAVALKRLAEESDTLELLSAQDLKICRTLRQYQNSWHYGTHFAFSEEMVAAVIGHPHLYWHHAPEVRVEVVGGNAELRVAKKPKGRTITLGLQPYPVGDGRYLVIKESPTRLKVVEYTEDHRRLAAILGPDGLSVPAEAEERVVRSLAEISGLVTVHSDIGGQAENVRQVEGDPLPRLNLLPHGPGLRVAMVVRPFVESGVAFRPGKGGESVLCEIGGETLQARRDLPGEKQRAARLLAGCPVLKEAEEEGGEWLLPEPEQCLELLLQVGELPEGSCALEWPEGVKFRLLGSFEKKAMGWRIKRDQQWFAVQGELRVDENTVLELHRLLELLDGGSRGRFLQLGDGQFLALTEEFRRRLEELRSYAEIGTGKVRLSPLAAVALDDWDDVEGDKHWRAQQEKLRQARAFVPQLPSTLQAELRDYQLEGYSWLARLAEWGVGACLADDMGLGKTIQALALLVQRAPNGPALVVAPTSVCINWQREAARFAPTLRPLFLGPGDRQQLLEGLGPFDLLVCSYGLLQQEQAAAMLASIAFHTVVLDEAQAIKNVATRRSQGAMALNGAFKMILTGTPLENHLGELWNLMRFINPGLLGSHDRFNARFAVPIERDGDARARRALKKLVQPFILRRTKTQVLQELPSRTEVPVYVELSPAEEAFYEALRRRSLAELEEGEGTAGQKHLRILAAITRLRRGCCHAKLIDRDLTLPSSKLETFAEIVDELLAGRHKALVFSQFVDHLQLIRERVEARNIPYQYLDGSTPAAERQKRVEAFQRGEGELFLISLKAGGLGLNLTAADYVIHMDPWWNPAVEDQASDRAHRIGQQRPVTIYRLIAKNTIEEKIVALHEHKRDLADSLLEGAELSGKLSAEELLRLMGVEG